MGLEAYCRVKLNAESSEGRAYCESSEITFRGEFRFKWLFTDLKSVESRGGVLILTKGEDQAELELGQSAEKWKQAITNPKSRFEKLGLKSGQSYGFIGEMEEAFSEELNQGLGFPSKDGQVDQMFVRLKSPSDTSLLDEATKRLNPKSSLWAIWPKGSREFANDLVRTHCRKIGLIDVKVVSFSPELTALKFVIQKGDQ